MTKRHKYIPLAALSMLLVGGNAWAQGGVDQPTTDLPPDGVYLSPSDVHAMYTGPELEIVLSAIQHQPFVPGQTTTDPTGESHFFNSSVEGIGQCNDVVAGACADNGLPPVFPVFLTGNVQTIAVGRSPSNQIGTFQTEMVSMNLSGGGVLIRENPLLPSLGETTVTDEGTHYHVDSFFDVFTELSLDGGTTWIPNSAPNPSNPAALGSTRVVLGIPEPASLALLALGVLGTAGLGRRRRA